MKRLVFSASLLFANGLHASEWFTLFGSAGVGSEDYVQADPTTIEVDGSIRRLDIRVNRALQRVSTDGVKFRSLEGKAEVDCASRSARYVAATFFAEPNFQGTPIKSLRFEKEQPRPVFSAIPGALDERLIKAACALQ
jgi:hypothetical protein